MLKRTLALGMTLLATGALVTAQDPRPASPRGTSATQLGDKATGLEITSGLMWDSVAAAAPLTVSK